MKKTSLPTIIIGVVLMVSSAVPSAAETVFEKTVDGWLELGVHQEESKPGHRQYRVVLAPLDWRTDAHRYKWNVEAWALGEPSVQLQVLRPQSLSRFDASCKSYWGALVRHGETRGQRPIRFEGKIGPETREFARQVANLVGKGVDRLPNLVGWAVDIADRVEGFNERMLKRDALAEYASGRYVPELIETPDPPDDFNYCETRLTIDVEPPRDGGDGFALLVKADRRQRHGQHVPYYYLVELP